MPVTNVISSKLKNKYSSLHAVAFIQEVRELPRVQRGRGLQELHHQQIRKVPSSLYSMVTIIDPARSWLRRKLLLGSTPSPTQKTSFLECMQSTSTPDHVPIISPIIPPSYPHSIPIYNLNELAGDQGLRTIPSGGQTV